MEKDKALDAALTQIERTFGKGSIMRLGQNTNMDIEAISTGSLGTDIALGIGGLPKGRIIEIYGPESSGKTTFALSVIAQSQKKGGTCAFVDAEHALDPSYAKKIGVDIENLLVSQPDSGEQALEIADKILVLHQGQQAFFGSPKETYNYFESDDPETILTNLNDETATQWKTVLQERVTAPIRSTSALEALVPSYFPKMHLSPVFLYKLSITAKQWFRDKGKFLTLLLQPLIIGFLFSQIFSNLTSLLIVAFAIILSANWLSLSLSIREIVQEKEILQAEFRKGVPVLPTILSKALLPTVVAFIQTLIVYTFVGFRTLNWPSPPQLLLVILLMVLPPVAMGLVVSSLSKNAGQANAMLPLLIIPQVALAGALVPLDQMQPIGRVLSTVIWSRYNQGSLLNLLLERKDSIENTILAIAITLCFYIVVAIKLNWSKKAK